MSRIAQQLRFLLEIDQLKEIRRQNYTIRGRRPETDAEHAWHVTMMAVLLAEHAQELEVLPPSLEDLYRHHMQSTPAGAPA